MGFLTSMRRTTCFQWFALLTYLCCLSGVFAATGTNSASSFSNSKSDNLAVYWGQDSAGNQQRLSFYCNDSTIDAIPLAFLYIFFDNNGEPVIDFANTCNQWDDATFPGTNLADCSFLAPDIQTCQSKGKIVTLSLGGGTGQVGFSSDAQAVSFAETIWNMFLGGDGDIRPFGNAILDGVDLDIESGTPVHYAAFVNKIRSLSAGAPKKYYVTAAPQCPFPDANIGGALNNASFDAVYVQFYNNFCELSVPSEFNFETWDNWARTTSLNRDIKVYIGAPGSANAAGEGYVDIDTLISMAQEAQSKYPSFGGVMLWDASEAYTNDRYDLAIKNALVSGEKTAARQISKVPASGSATKTTGTAGHSTLIPSTATVRTNSREATSTEVAPSGNTAKFSRVFNLKKIGGAGSG